MNPPLLLFVVLTAVQLPSVAAPRDSAEPVRATGAIAGRVTEQESGRPLPRAIVRLVTTSHRLEAVADTQGRYEFTSLEPGEYALWAAPEELVATHLPQASGAAAPMRPFSEPQSNISLKAGEVLTEMNIALTRALAIEGRISDPWDEPMANVEVIVMHADGTSVQTNGSYSDDRGEFRVYGLAPGRYRVCAHPRDSSDAESGTSRMVRTCHLASISDANAADVMLETHDATGIDIRVQRSATYSVTGSVLDAAGAPADGARLIAVCEDDPVRGSDASSGGRFILRGLTPGRYSIWAAIGGPANPSDTRPPARERELGFTSVDIDSADVSNVTLSLSRAQRIRGRVVFDGRAPAPRQLRLLVQTGSSQAGWGWVAERAPSGAVDDDLSFELTEVYRLPLVVGLRGLPDGWVLKSVAFGGRDITDVATDLGSAPKNRLEIRVTNLVARPKIRVTDNFRRPVASYALVLLPVDPARWKDARWTADETPSRDGVLQLRPRLAGDYLAAALPPNDYELLVRDRSRIEDLAAVARRVTLAEGDDQIVELPLTRLPPARQ